MVDSQDVRVQAWMSKLRAKTAELDRLQLARWENPQKPKQAKKPRVNQFSPETWYTSAPIETDRKKMFLPRKMAAVGYYSSLKVNHRRRPAA